MYVNRLKSGEGTKFSQLFDILDKQEEYNEQEILNKASSIKPQQLSNLKAHLYKQLLKSLRLKNLNSDIEISIREWIDYARVLYNKGLYQQSLRVLEKAKGMAEANRKNILHMEIVDYEKLIELQYITRSIGNRADELTSEIQEVSRKIHSAQTYSNLALKLYSLYLKVGSAKNKKDMLMVSSFFNSNFVPPEDISRCDFYEKLYIYQAYLWYNYITQDFLMCYKYAQKWVDLYRNNSEMIYNQTDMYLKGINSLLNALHMLRYHPKFEEELGNLQELIKNKKIPWNDNNLRVYYLFYYKHRINYHFLEGTFSEGVKLIPEINEYIKNYSRHLDNHRILVFYYKIASLYFGSGDYRSTIRYLNYILNFRDISIRQDFHSFARILNLVAHYELGNEDLLEYQVKSVYRFLYKMDNLQQVQRHVVDFLRRLTHINPDDLHSEFEKLRDKLVSLKDDPFEQRAFLYLDIISWLESKIENRPVQDIIREKALKERAKSEEHRAKS
ncbi:MAG: hypothetical protein ACQER7_13190 [Bacteroidota bacterium]